MIVCVGEILADMIGKTEGGRTFYERYAGGAPFNVACGMKDLGTECGFCGRVGKDLIGDFLADFAARKGFDFLDVGKDPERNTTLAFVELDEKGERHFSFYRKHTADYALPLSAVEKIVAAADIVHLGSLMLSETEGRAFADELIESARKAGKRVSFDVNYRDDIFKSQEEAVSVYGKYLEKADIVKLSEEELSLFSKAATVEERLLEKAVGGKIVFVTLGSGGSMVCADGKIFKESIRPVRALDTTGAGDAFFAGVLSAMDADERDWNKVLRMGNICGSLTVQHKGAVGAFCKESVMRALKE